MNQENQSFPSMIVDGYNKMRKIPGWRKMFQSRFKKSESTVSNWKSGKTEATEEDKIHFLEVVTGIVKEYDQSRQKLDTRKAQVIREYLDLSA